MQQDPPLRIAVLGINYAPEQTGIAPYAAGLASGLARAGATVNVLTAHPHYPEWKIREGFGGWVHDSEVDGVQVRRLLHYVPATQSSMKRLLSELSFGFRLVTQPWGSPDVVVLVSPALFSSAVAGMKARMLGIPTAVWVQDLYSLGITEAASGGASAARAARSLESRTLRRAGRVVVIHDRFKTYVTDTLDVPAENVDVVRNWTHVQTAHAVDRDAVRARLGWADDELIVLHAGNIGAKQALENVVDAARLADVQELPVRFVILGTGNAVDAVKAHADGVSRVEFVDPLPNGEFEDALASADVLLVNEKPGVREMAVPSKLTTYFSTGLPVIAATDDGSITAGEVESSGGGVRVDAGDPQQLLDVAMELKADPERSHRLGQAGLRYRTEVLGEQAAIDLYAQLLHRLASSHGRRRRGRGRRPSI